MTTACNPKNPPQKNLSTDKMESAELRANSSVQQTWARELIAKLNLRGDEHLLDVGAATAK